MPREGETYRKDVFEPERGDRLWHALGDRQILRGRGEKAVRTCRGSWESSQRKRKQGGRLRAREGRMKEPLAGKGVCAHQGGNAGQHQRPTWDEPRNPDLEKTVLSSVSITCRDVALLLGKLIVYICKQNPLDAIEKPLHTSLFWKLLSHLRWIQGF